MDWFIVIMITLAAIWASYQCWSMLKEARNHKCGMVMVLFAGITTSCAILIPLLFLACKFK